MWNTRKELEIDWQNGVPIACAGYLGHPFAKEPFTFVRISSPLILRL